MKVDLDDLERKSRALSAVNTMDEIDPDVTLALIARIRELEALAEGLIEEIATNLPGSRRGELDDERALLEKGAVIP